MSFEKGGRSSSETTRSSSSITYSLKFVMAVSTSNPDHTAFSHCVNLYILMQGSSNVGKTALYRRFMNKGYKSDDASTVGMEFSTRDMLFERTIVKAQVDLYCLSTFITSAPFLLLIPCTW